MGDRQVVPDQARAIARALASADNNGDESEWQLWLPMGIAVHDSFPSDFLIVSDNAYKTLNRTAAESDPTRSAILNQMVAAVRSLLLQFLDPKGRAIALGQIAEALTALDQYEWRREERNGR